MAFLKKILFLVLICLPALLYAQETGPVKSNDKNQQKADKKKAEMLEKQARAEEKGRERHMKIQTKETRKRMKRSKKKSRRINEQKDEFFLKKLFRKKSRA